MKISSHKMIDKIFVENPTALNKTVKCFILIANSLFFLSTTMLFSQQYSISGFVKDNLSGDVLIGANVFVDGTTIGTSSDKKGFFKNPNLIKKFTISNKKDFDNSLEKSVNFFIKHCRRKKKFEKKLFLKSISTNKYLLNYKF